MRPSSLIAILIAVVVALVGVTGLRLLNVFGAARPAEMPAISVVVANQPILQGTHLTSRMVRVRPLRADEMAPFLSERNKYPAPMESAVALFVARENILADQPIRFDNLEDLKVPEGIPYRLAPNMRPVSLSIRLEDASGGMLRVGDWVSVLMTSLVTGPGLKDSPRQATIISAGRIIRKNNTLRTIYNQLPPDKPVPFEVETTPYLAALTEFARDKGDFSLIAISEAESRELEARRQTAIDAAPGPPQVRRLSLRSTGPGARASLTRRVDDSKAPPAQIGTADLVALFGLVTPVALAPPPAARPNTYIRQYAGTDRRADVVVSPAGQILSRSTGGGPGDDDGPRVINTPLGTSSVLNDEGKVMNETPSVAPTPGAAARRDAGFPLLLEYTFRKPSVVNGPRPDGTLAEVNGQAQSP